LDNSKLKTQNSKLKKIGVLVSGRGSNLQALLDACAGGELAGLAEVALVISNHAGVQALERAARAGVRTLTMERASYESKPAQHMAWASALREAGVELVVTAGFDRIIEPQALGEFPGPVMNIHPSLLPAFGGGLHAVADALAYGVNVSGCTVHFTTLDDAVDAGPIIAQAAVPVYGDDDEEKLAARILAEEHRLLVQAVAWWCAGRIRVVGRRVYIE
jgi:phosphoribosylglycinamide formyltransferase 1